MNKFDRRGRTGRTALVVVATAILGLSAIAGAAAWTGGPNAGKPTANSYSYGHSKKQQSRSRSQPVRAMVLTPSAGETTRSGFNVSISLQARNTQGNNLLAGYATRFVDPTGPDGKGNPGFHPGASASAPGLVVTLSTTPTVAGTPLVGPRTNLAGVFQINSVTRSHGLRETWNDWQVTSPGFFGMNRSATLTVYAVQGNAPDAVPAGGLHPISNVVHQTFQIGS
jgi:hypothetical protein